MSGPLSVPLAIAGAVGLSFSEQTNSKILYGLLLLTGIVTGVQAAFSVWRRPQERIIELEEQTRPKLTLEFSTTIPGCVRPTAIKVRRRSREMTSSEPAMRMWSTDQAEVATSTSTVVAAAPQLASTIYGDREVCVPCVYYRIKVDTDTVPAIEECHGYLVSVDYLNGTERKTVLAGDNLDLTFARAEEPDTRSKRVSAGICQYLDFLAITNDNRVLVTTYQFQSAISAHADELFERYGYYRLRIGVSYRGGPTKFINIQLHWTGNQKLAELTEI